ncbi:hypothetical protein DSO57_1021981 [Entomophthora muscae]|uniref:Uncharacterized protein n=2 Tax=Entomophthora muscae TaxID=34485 RepID=A0ACC2SFZ0_9FUNG|nr:hypothetical protein DSO57_1021981 [Entomophthora muscae]
MRSKSDSEHEEQHEFKAQENSISKPGNIFSHEITSIEKSLIEMRVSEQQKKFQEHDRQDYEKRSKVIKRMFEYLVDQEIKFALKENDNNVSEVITRFTEEEYLQHIRRSIAKEEPSNLIFNMSQEKRDAYDSLMQKRLNQLKNKAVKPNKERGHSVPRLALDNALKQMEKDPKSAMEGWSQARITAYQAIHTRPNSYYYRFNAPGEEQRTGPWTNAEKKLFLERVKEHGTDKDWGIFSMTIPGRVGYQCSSFYRLLIQRGEIKDHRYVIDAKGKAQFLFSGKQNNGPGEPREKRASISKPKGKTRPPKKSKKSSDYSDESSGEEFVGPAQADWRTTSRTRRFNVNEDSINNEPTPSDQEDGDEELLNPLPGYIDPITLDEVVQPAISPYGHVMGYANWVRCLNSEATRNTCPLTKQPLTKRDLVILTHDNIELYRDKIIK